MLRSFSYAARAALQTARQRRPANAATLEAWATAWENAASNAFLRGYREAIAANPLLLPPSAQDSAQGPHPAARAGPDHAARLLARKSLLRTLI
jgi:predicted trehalose synthase